MSIDEKLNLLLETVGLTLMNEAFEGPAELAPPRLLQAALLCAAAWDKDHEEVLGDWQDRIRAHKRMQTGELS